MKSLSLEDLCIHQVCIWKQSNFKESLECLARNGVFKTALWKPLLKNTELKQAKQNLRDSGVQAVSMCPLVLLDEEAYPNAIARHQSHQQFLEDAAELEVQSVVVITGGLSKGSRDLIGQREKVLEELERLAQLAEATGVRLALEPLHPMVCGYRSVISSLSEANDLLDHLNRDDVYGIAVDTYALWWDSNLQQQIRRSGKRLINFHVSDWLTETKDLRLDRGMPGDGIIDNPLIRGWMEESEYQGSIEIEILSALNCWKQPSETVIKTICQSLANL